MRFDTILLIRKAWRWRLINLGNLAFKERDLAEAEEQFQRSRTIYQDINDKGGLAAANWGLGMIACEQGDFARTQGYFERRCSLRWTLIIGRCCSGCWSILPNCCGRWGSGNGR